LPPGCISAVRAQRRQKMRAAVEEGMAAFTRSYLRRATEEVG
jgi:hypothetical protein